MSIKRIKDFQDGNTDLTEDDIFLFMDDPSGNSVTKKVSLSTISALLGGNSTNTSVFSLGPTSGSTPINYSNDKLIQTLSLNGSVTTFSKGTGWPTSSSVSVDVILKITVSSATSITWTIVTDWFSQPPAGALAIGTHLFLLRAIGSSIIEGHYLGTKTN